jgi:hypothetical protein
MAGRQVGPGGVMLAPGGTPYGPCLSWPCGWLLEGMFLLLFTYFVHVSTILQIHVEPSEI